MTTLQDKVEAERIFALFQGAGAVPVETDILQPAGTLLDLYGEDIRARAFITQDPIRGETMLRPDFTVPVVQAHMAEGAEPARYCYRGKVFRKQDRDEDRATEYLQVGYEVFDRSDPAAADAEVFALFSKALAGLDLRATIGDFGILISAVNGLATSERRRAALRRHIWRPRRFRALMNRFTHAAPVPATRGALLDAVAAGGVDLVLEKAGPVIGLRAPDEVRARIEALVEDAQDPPLGGAEAEVISTILSLRGKSTSALTTLRDIAVDLPAVGAAVDRFEARLSALSARGVDVAELDFEAVYGRSAMEYYDGFVFGFTVPGRADLPPVASGGRYDALTAVLGGGQAIPAVGGVIRPSLVAEVRG